MPKPASSPSPGTTLVTNSRLTIQRKELFTSLPFSESPSTKFPRWKSVFMASISDSTMLVSMLKLTESPRMVTTSKSPALLVPSATTLPLTSLLILKAKATSTPPSAAVTSMKPNKTPGSLVPTQDMPPRPSPPPSLKTLELSALSADSNSVLVPISDSELPLNPLLMVKLPLNSEPGLIPSFSPSESVSFSSRSLRKLMLSASAVLRLVLSTLAMVSEMTLRRLKIFLLKVLNSLLLSATSTSSMATITESSTTIIMVRTTSPPPSLPGMTLPSGESSMPSFTPLSLIILGLLLCELTSGKRKKI
mmetsp:Transcript_32839/g.29694  ORF Transcript_32839/g.29694 Transcript_32839/m.29694 type:complete len:306 (+) Transcript_32839:133-1050(+)